MPKVPSGGHTPGVCLDDHHCPPPGLDMLAHKVAPAARLQLDHPLPRGLVLPGQQAAPRDGLQALEPQEDLRSKTRETRAHEGLGLPRRALSSQLSAQMNSLPRLCRGPPPNRRPPELSYQLEVPPRMAASPRGLQAHGGLPLPQKLPPRRRPQVRGVNSSHMFKSVGKNCF